MVAHQQGPAYGPRALDTHSMLSLGQQQLTPTGTSNRFAQPECPVRSDAGQMGLRGFQMDRRPGMLTTSTQSRALSGSRRSSVSTSRTVTLPSRGGSMHVQHAYARLWGSRLRLVQYSTAQRPQMSKTFNIAFPWAMPLPDESPRVQLDTTRSHDAQ
jgi:hypothetical protein